MNAAYDEQWLALVAAHCVSLDPLALTARERLDVVLGPELAHMLVFALSARGARGRERGGLGVPVFAA